LARYDTESNKWHDSILVARKRPQSLGEKMRQRLFAVARRRLHPLPQKFEALIQIYYSHDAVHREEDSVIAGVEYGRWKNLVVTLPPWAGTRPLRIDFMRSLELIDIAEVRVTVAKRELFAARSNEDFNEFVVGGDAERVPYANGLRLRITGIDPQLYLPALELDPGEGKLNVEMRLRVFDR
jgi:hypothetical protein